LAKTTLTNVELLESTETQFTVPLSINLFLETELAQIELTTEFLRRVSINKFSPDWRFFRHVTRQYCIIQEGNTVRRIPIGNDDASIIKWKASFQIPFVHLFGVNPSIQGQMFAICIDGISPNEPGRDPKLAGAPQ
jgi:hypothetical protein